MVEPSLAATINTAPALSNRLLGALPNEVLWYLRPHLKPVSLTRGKVLCEADEPLRRVYFVESGAVSLVTVFEDGTTAEMATVGREGVVGIDTLLGGEHSLGRYVVPCPALLLRLTPFGSRLRCKTMRSSARPVRPTPRPSWPTFSRTSPATPAIGSSNDARAGC